MQGSKNTQLGADGKSHFYVGYIDNPYVFAETDKDALYGLDYPTARDRAFQMYYNLRIIQGRPSVSRNTPRVRCG